MDKKLIHRRSVIVESFETGSGLVIEGRLQDERFFPSYYYTRESFVDPGVIHGMRVRLQVSMPDMTIRTAEAEIGEVPLPECREIRESVGLLAGTPIRKGFSGKVRGMFGGKKGCLHIMNLILVMGSAAMQGFWAYYSRVRKDDRVRKPAFDESLLVDSCWLWRSDGPLWEKFRKAQNIPDALPRKHIITIDGPAGAGKSTIAREVARRLSYRYLDTGALYRALAYKALRKGISGEEGLASLCRETRIEVRLDQDKTSVFVDGEDVTGRIRTPEIGMAASEISALPVVREALLSVQRDIAKEGGIVAEGRDMGTVVFPEADFKFFLDASPEERGRRRFLELREKDPGIEAEGVLRDLEKRDIQDRKRKIAPLKPPKGAIIVDSTGLSVEDVVENVIKAIDK
ncbi:MAG: (d)CMP kinase [Syntrophales bacterium]